MKIEAKTLLAALKRASIPTSDKAYLPIQRSLRLRSQTDLLVIQSTSLDVEACISLKVPGSVDAPDAIVNAKESLRIVALMEGTLDVSLTPEALLLVSGRHRVSIPATPLEGKDWPRIEFETGQNAVDVDLSLPALQRALRLVDHARDGNGTRPNLVYICLDLQSDTCRAVATDGMRLASAKVADLSTVAPHQILLPPHIVRAINDAKGARAVITTRLQPSSDPQDTPQGHTLTLDGEFWSWCASQNAYPHYTNVIPQASPPVRIACGSQIVSALKLALKMREGNRGVHIANVGAEASLTLPDTSGTLQALHETFPNTATGNEDLRVYLNPQYLADALAVLPESTLEMIDPLSPVTLRKGDDFALLMPMRY